MSEIAIIVPKEIPIVFFLRKWMNVYSAAFIDRTQVVSRSLDREVETSVLQAQALPVNPVQFSGK